MIQALDPLEEDPILFLGLDIGIRRDTTAVVAIAQDYKREGGLKLHSHRIWSPPVNIVDEVEPFLFWMFRNLRIAALHYDPYQCMATQQKLLTAGYGDRLQEVNQQTAMVAAANSLHGAITEGRLRLYPDDEIQSHFSWTRAKHTERGWRIVKTKQSKSIDFVVALAMAILGATSEIDHAMHPSYTHEIHARSAMDIP